MGKKMDRRSELEEERREEDERRTEGGPKSEERRSEAARSDDRERRRRLERDQGAWPYAGPLSASGYRQPTHMGYPGYMGYPWSRFSHGTDPSYEDWQGPGFGTHTPGGWEPRVETYHRGKDMIVRVELPGWDKDEVTVCLEDEDLVVEGKREHEVDDEERREFEERGGRDRDLAERFTTRVSLPGPCDSGDVKAKFKNGVLEVRIPAPERHVERRTVKIDI